MRRNNKKQRATTNIRHPRPGRPRVVPITSTQTLSMNLTPPAGVPSVPGPIGLSRHSQQLLLRLHRKHFKHTEKSARMYFIVVPSDGGVSE